MLNISTQSEHILAFIATGLSYFYNNSCHLACFLSSFVSFYDRKRHRIRNLEQDGSGSCWVKIIWFRRLLSAALCTVHSVASI